MDRIDHAARLWDRAEECRALADLASDAQLKAQYRKLADAYLRLAACEEAVKRLLPG